MTERTARPQQRPARGTPARAGSARAGLPRTTSTRSASARRGARPAPPRRRSAPRRRRLLRLGDPSRRLLGLLLVAAVVLSLFGGRILQLQAVDASAYASRASAELTTERTVPASRGAILDRTGVPLATTVAAVNVTVDQRLVRDPAAVAGELAPLLGLPEYQVAAALTGRKAFAYVAKNVPPEVWQRVREAKLPGIYRESAPRRVYPAGAVGGNVVGFVGSDGTPLSGAEYAFNSVLAGQPGTATYERGAGAREIPLGGTTDVPARDGRSLRLTLDRDIQFYAQQVLAAKVREVRARSGSLVAIDTRTGKILAMATAPTVDPARPGKARAEDRGNRPVEESYEPGSVEKALTAAALLDTRTVSTRTVFTVPDSLLRGAHRIHDHSPHAVQRLTFAGIIAQSSNVGTMLAAERMPKAQLRDYLVRFGLGSPPGLGLPGETGGDLPGGTSWTDLTRDTAAFGQGLAVSIVQLASAYATIANGGVRVAPSIVDAYVDPNGAVSDPPPPAVSRVVSARAAAQTRTALEAVMGPDGTGRKLAIPGYRLAGKTGTAERLDPGCSCYRGYTASFAGFAPADDPRIAVVVSLQAPVRGYYGGQVAGPVWRDVLGFALQRLSVPPTGRQAPKVPVFSSR